MSYLYKAVREGDLEPGDEAVHFVAVTSWMTQEGVKLMSANQDLGTQMWESFAKEPHTKDVPWYDPERLAIVRVVAPGAN